jgi:hypothetical protein
VLRVIGWVNLLSKVRLLTEPRTILQTAKRNFLPLRELVSWQSGKTASTKVQKSGNC